MVTNNPSHAVFGHFSDWMRITSRHPRPMMMLNIGTGTSKDQTAVTAGGPLWSDVLPKALLDFWHVTRDLSTMATQCEDVGKLMRQIGTLNPLFQNWRFSEDQTMA
jgi:hypothetical protein